MKYRNVWMAAAALAGPAAIATLVLGDIGAAPARQGDEPLVHQAEVAAAGEADRMAQGRALYLAHCSGCHQPTGQGLPGAFPPLAGADYLLEDRGRAIETIIARPRKPPTAAMKPVTRAVRPPCLPKVHNRCSPL